MPTTLGLRRSDEVLTDASDLRVRSGGLGDVEEADERLVADLVQRDLERIGCVRDALERGEDRGEDGPNRDCGMSAISYYCYSCCLR